MFLGIPGMKVLGFVVGPGFDCGARLWLGGWSVAESAVEVAVVGPVDSGEGRQGRWLFRRASAPVACRRRLSRQQ